MDRILVAVLADRKPKNTKINTVIALPSDRLFIIYNSTSPALIPQSAFRVPHFLLSASLQYAAADDRGSQTAISLEGRFSALPERPIHPITWPGFFPSKKLHPLNFECLPN
jgi:hypothetical protein